MDVSDPKTLGSAIRTVRRALGVTQDQLALASGTNRRFVVEVEKGKPTAQVGKVLQVLRTLGIGATLTPPPGVEIPSEGDSSAKEGKRGPAA